MFSRASPPPKQHLLVHRVRVCWMGNAQDRKVQNHEPGLWMLPLHRRSPPNPDAGGLRACSVVAEHCECLVSMIYILCNILSQMPLGFGNAVVLQTMYSELANASHILGHAYISESSCTCCQFTRDTNGHRHRICAITAWAR